VLSPYDHSGWRLSQEGRSDQRFNQIATRVMFNPEQLGGLWDCEL
jgi:hypothetical protein